MTWRDPDEKIDPVSAGSPAAGLCALRLLSGFRPCRPGQRRRSGPPLGLRAAAGEGRQALRCAGRERHAPGREPQRPCHIGKVPGPRALPGACRGAGRESHAPCHVHLRRGRGGLLHRRRSGAAQGGHRPGGGMRPGGRYVCADRLAHPQRRGSQQLPGGGQGLLLRDGGALPG